MLDTILVALLPAAVPSFGCTVRCPCTVPAGVDWHSAVVMVPRAHKDADAIFRGYVLSADTVAQDTSALASPIEAPRRLVRTTIIRYTFAVERSWKGSRERRLVVTNYGVDTSCGRVYKQGVSYLIYADKDRQGNVRDSFSTYSCSRVRSGHGADDDIAVLGAGRPPKD
jgi:hypothetical protein